MPTILGRAIDFGELSSLWQSRSKSKRGPTRRIVTLVHEIRLGQALDRVQLREAESSFSCLSRGAASAYVWGERTEPSRAFALPQVSNARIPSPRRSWRRSRQERRGEFRFCSPCPGAANGSLRRAILTPGYMLSLLRSCPNPVMYQNLRTHQEVDS